MQDNGFCDFKRVCRFVYLPEVLNEIDTLKQSIPAFIAHVAPRVEIVPFAAVGLINHDDGGVFDPSHTFKRFVVVLRKGLSVCV